MPIEVDAMDGPAAGSSASPRPVASAAPPPELLLHPDGDADLRSRGERRLEDMRPPGKRLPPQPGSPGDRHLALDALRLVHLLARPGRPGRWHAAAFARHVDLVRAHLAPIHDPVLLAASFDREAFHVTGRRPCGLAAAPVRVAYALRWLELQDGEARPAWRALVGAAGVLPEP